MLLAAQDADAKDCQRMPHLVADCGLPDIDCIALNELSFKPVCSKSSQTDSNQSEQRANGHKG